MIIPPLLPILPQMDGKVKRKAHELSALKKSGKRVADAKGLMYN
jgi:hypothetical protein